MTTYFLGNKAKSLYFNHNGIKHHILHYKNENMPKILFLHGWMDCAHSFQFTIDCLQKNWDIYSLDWRGFGLSAWQEYGYYDRMLMISDLKKTLQTLSPDEPIHVVGHSMGGMLAAQLAGFFPSSIKSLVLAEGFGLPDMPINMSIKKIQNFLNSNEDIKQHQPRPINSLDIVIRKLQQKNPLMTMDKIHFIAQALTYQQDGVYYYNADPKHHFSQPYLYHIPQLSLIWSQITAPVLWIEGDLSEHNYYMQTMHELLPERRESFKSIQKVIRIPKAGHLMQWEAPEEFAQHLEEFWLSFAN